jgi:hypothetical protein
MVFVCMEEFLGYEVFGIAAVASKLDIEVYTLLDLWKYSGEGVNLPLGTCMYDRP